MKILRRLLFYENIFVGTAHDSHDSAPFIISFDQLDMVERHSEVFVYLCEQNQSLPQFGNVARNRLRTSDTLSNMTESRRKTGSLEKLRIRDRLSSISPLRNLFVSNSLTPWRSLRDLTKTSTSDSSVNNLDACRDIAGSTNHIDTDCVSPRVSSNSLASIQIDSLDLNDSILGFNIPGEDDSAPKTSILSKHNLENTGTIYTQRKPISLTKRKSTFTFSRSTSCPLVVPAIHLKRFEGKSERNEQLKLEESKAEEKQVTIVYSTDKSSHQQASKPVHDSPCRRQHEPSKDDKHAKKSAQSAKSLARSKCMQWLNSLDEDD